MSWETWTVVTLFVVNLVFVVIMIFVSPYYRLGLGSTSDIIASIVYMCLLAITVGVFTTYSVKCNLGHDGACKTLAYLIICLVAVFTALHIGRGIYNAVTYKKDEDAGFVFTHVNQE